MLKKKPIEDLEYSIKLLPIIQLHTPYEFHQRGLQKVLYLSQYVPITDLKQGVSQPLLLILCKRKLKWVFSTSHCENTRSEKLY